MSSSGYSLIELLAAVMLLGLLAMTATGLTTILAHAVKDDELQADALEQRLHAVRRLRAEAAHAHDAHVFGGRLELMGPKSMVRWGVRQGALLRLAQSDLGPCDVEGIRIQPGTNGRLVVIDAVPWGRVVVRIGGRP
jgi:prepilin-type N-terminal cleavage/methylation domain-containing protein